MSFAEKVLDSGNRRHFSKRSLIVAFLKIVERAFRLIEALLDLRGRILSFFQRCRGFRKLLLSFGEQCLRLRTRLNRAECAAEVALLQAGRDILRRVETLLKLRQHLVRL